MILPSSFVPFLWLCVRVAALARYLLLIQCGNYIGDV